jgi:thymidylate synthase (FAD)
MRFKAPIFVARQLVKHQVGLVWNEVSRRYVKDTPEFYYPSNLHKAPEKSKQGASDEQFPNAADALLLMRDMTQATLAVYEGLIEEGLAPEEARIVLPLNTYTEWLWTGSLAAWARVHHLRADPHTQSATRRYAVAVDEIMKEIVPVSWDALTRKEAHDN